MCIYIPVMWKSARVLVVAASDRRCESSRTKFSQFTALLPPALDVCVLNRGSKTAEGLAPPSTLPSSSHFSIGAGRRKRRREPAAHTRCCWLSRLEQISRRKKSAINRRVELFFTLFLFLSLFSLSLFFLSLAASKTHTSSTHTRLLLLLFF